RRPIGNDMLAAIMYLEVGRADLAEIDRDIRQECWLRFLRFVLGALLRPFRRRVLPSWWRADEAAKIGHAHIMRGEIGGDLGPLTGAIDVEVALEIAFAHATDELGEADGFAAIIVIEVAAQRIRRRWLQGEMQDLIEIREVLALKLELQIGT